MRRRTAPPQPARPMSNADFQGDCFRQGFALVVAALPFSPPMQWNRDDDVDFRLAEPGFVVVGPYASKAFGQGFTRSVLHPQNRIAKQTIVRPQTERPLEMESLVAAAGTAVLQVREFADTAAAARACRVRIGCQSDDA